MPRLISGCPKTAVSLATIISQAIAISQPSAQRIARYSSDDGFLVAAKVEIVANTTLHQVFDVGLVGHLLDVSPRRKSPFVARDDHATNIRVGIKGSPKPRVIRSSKGR